MISRSYMKFKDQQNETLVLEVNMVATGDEGDWEGHRGPYENTLSLDDGASYTDEWTKHSRCEERGLAGMPEGKDGVGPTSSHTRMEELVREVEKFPE